MQWHTCILVALKEGFERLWKCVTDSGLHVDVYVLFVYTAQSARPDWLWSGVGFRLDDRVYREDRVTLILKQQRASSRRTLTGSDSAFAADLLPLLLSVWIYFPSPFLPPPPAHIIFSFSSLLISFCLLLLLHSDLFTATPLVFEFLWPASHWVQYELAEQVEPAGSWEPVRPEHRPLQPLHCWPGDLPHGVWEPLETGELETHLFSCILMKLHTLLWHQPFSPLINILLTNFIAEIRRHSISAIFCFTVNTTEQYYPNLLTVIVCACSRTWGPVSPFKISGLDYYVKIGIYLITCVNVSLLVLLNYFVVLLWPPILLHSQTAVYWVKSFHKCLR